MLFDLRFPSIDPWTDLEELLAPPEALGADREPPPAGRAAPVVSRTRADRAGEGASADSTRASPLVNAAAGR